MRLFKRNTQTTDTEDISPLKKVKHRWYQCRLRTLLIFVTLAALGISWFGMNLHRARRQREAIEAILKMGNVVLNYECQLELKNVNPKRLLYGPAWLRKLLGDDFFNDVALCIITEKGDIHSALEHCKEFPELEELEIWGRGLTDDDLKNIPKLKNLRNLSIWFGEKITVAGWDSIKEMKQLQGLQIGRIRFTDDDLAKFQDLPNLRRLYLDFAGTPHITKKGLQTFTKYPALQKLWLGNTGFTDEDIEQIHKEKPHLKIYLFFSD
jgi:hypothetical protein